ncbi:MMPL family transporter [uncultured Luteimonas sp.]|uniref:MMPL family transporter n=1 Tax=uncultured Luteimonas sp. TaxID=453144 RepID=UPI00263291AF|nr:MMPL family transporter [uncultured Luteimonas sp.]
MSARARLAWALGWLGLLLAVGGWLSQTLSFSGDLRRFLPDPRTPEQRLLIDELGEGPGSRLLLVALAGADVDTLAAQSHAMAATLSADARFGFVANGAGRGLEAIPAHLRPYRYLLSPTLDAQRLDAQFLRAEIAQRVQDLGSPAGELVEPLLPSDPTLETLRLAEAWLPARAPQTLHEAWFDRSGTQALLLVETRAAGFDPDGQREAVEAIQAAHAGARGDDPGTLELSGPGAFADEIGSRTAREAGWIGAVDSIGLVLLLLVAYRSWKIPLLGALPLASAGIAGLATLVLLFGDRVHGITIAFGFTLIGVVQDYPIHFFSQQRAGLSPWRSVRALWPTLATGVAATCIAYLTFLFSGVDGLRQLAVFTIVALATAALCTRFALPALIDPARRDVADSPRLRALWERIERLPRPRWSLLVLALLALAVIAWRPGAFWQNDLAKLTPVPAPLLERDAQLRDELGAPDVRYVLTVAAADAEAALQSSERLRPALDALVARGALDGYDMAARYLPSVALQRARQQALPPAAALRDALDAALVDSPFRGDAFEPFLADIETARAAPPLAPGDLDGTPLASSVQGLLVGGGEGATALVSLSGLHDVDAVARVAAQGGARLLDMKQASESLVADYRVRILGALALAALLLVATVWIALRSPRRTLRVLLPMALTTLLVLALLRALGVELTLFHLISLILAAGLGLDYALFFEHAGDSRDDQLRTLHAVIVCSLMTLLVFSLLALSSIPVLRAIGSTVALGVLSNFVLSLLVSRAPGGTGTAGRSAAEPEPAP